MPIKTSYSPTTGTAYVTFDNIRVPVENQPRALGEGLRIRSRTADDRRGMSEMDLAAQGVRQAAQLADRRPREISCDVARAEAVQAWLENVTYQMCNSSYKDQATNLAGQITFLKMYSTRCAQDTARDAVQIFGGRSMTQTGMGRFIEHYYRTVTFDRF